MASLGDIPVNELPRAVYEVLEQYMALLRQAASLDQAADLFTGIAGGALVNESPDPVSLRSSVKPYGLKKDVENVQFYAEPIRITRVNCGAPVQSGFGDTAIAGPVYKIWIAKKEGIAGLPAPISILLPQGHPHIHTPKVIAIGSL